MMKQNRPKGFTIVEILVVISILGILATITLVFSVKIQKQSHDREHKTDVAILMSYLEKYYGKNGQYPYGATLNPTSAADTLPNYDAVKTTMPGITDDTLNGSAGYNFFAFACSGSCNLNSAQRLIKKKQYIYMTALAGNSSYDFAIDKGDDFWGCRLTFNDTDPAAVIAWRSEDTGKWTFVKSLHGTVTMQVYSGGPTPPTTCTLENS